MFLSGPLGPYDFGQLDREDVGHGDSRHLGIGFWHWRQALPDGARRAERKPPCEHCSDHGVTSHTASSSGNWMAEHHRRGTLDLVRDTVMPNSRRCCSTSATSTQRVPRLDRRRGHAVAESRLGAERSSEFVHVMVPIVLRANEAWRRLRGDGRLAKFR